MALSERFGLQGLWGLAVMDGLDDDTASRLLSHSNEHVRAWTVRLLGDRKRTAPALARRLAELASADASVTVRAQLAASARRLPAPDALPIVEGLWRQDRDLADPRIPMLVWWATETHAIAARDAVLTSFARPLHSKLRAHTQALLVRRYAAEGTAQGYDSAARLLTPSVLDSLEQGLAERSGFEIPPDSGVFGRFAERNTWSEAQRRTFSPVEGRLLAAIVELWREAPADPVRVRLALRAGLPGVVDAVLKSPARELVDALTAAAPQVDPSGVVGLLNSSDDAVAQAAFGLAARFPSSEATRALLRLAPKQSRAVDVLLSRAESARPLIAEPTLRGLLNQQHLHQIALLKDRDLDAQVRRHWGNMRAGTPEEKLATVRRLNNDLRLKPGDAARGRNLYLQHCGSCHKLRGEGGTLGMDLTAANRKDRYYMLTQIVDPSAFIRKEYMTVDVRTRDGRVASGLIAEEDAAAVTIIDGSYRKTRIARGDVAGTAESAVSLMPEGILERLKATQIQDLFAYLEAQ